MVKRGESNGKELEFKKGLWSSEEDSLLLEYVKVHGKGKWNRISHLTGLKRRGKSCRLRWMNYLSPNINRGDFSQEEDDLIIRLHNLLGNRWSLIAGRVPGRTDNQVKNYWNTHLSKKLKGKNKSIQTSSHSQDFMDDKTINSNASPSVKRNEVVAKRAFAEISSREDESTTKKQRNFQTSLVFCGEDDNLIVDTQSLFDFLSEYSLDFTWNKIKQNTECTLNQT